MFYKTKIKNYEVIEWDGALDTVKEISKLLEPYGKCAFISLDSKFQLLIIESLGVYNLDEKNIPIYVNIKNLMVNPNENIYFVKEEDKCAFWNKSTFDEYFKKNDTLYLVADTQNTTEVYNWSIIGIYSTEEKALKECKGYDNFCISPIQINDTAPKDYNEVFPGAYFPSELQK